MSRKLYGFLAFVLFANATAATTIVAVHASAPEIDALAFAPVLKTEAASALEEIIASDAPVTVRSAAIRALGHAGSRANAATLARIVDSVREPTELRQEALFALACTARDVSAIPVFVKTLDDPSEQLRIAAIQVLATTRNPDGWVALERHASRAVSTNERAWLDRALGKL